MASADLSNLYRLHLIDTAIVEIRKKAAALDPGRKIQAEINALEKAYQEKSAEAKLLHGEQADFELQQKKIDDKLKKIDGDIYGGKIVNPREVENLQKEMEILKRKRSELDDKILDLMEQAPKTDLKPYEKRIAEKKAELTQHQAQARVIQSKLEAEFKEKAAQRPIWAKEVSASLLAKYEAIRKKLDGVGMTEIVARTSCASCGTMLAEKTMEGAKEGRIVTCDSCHRIVYSSEVLA